MNDFSYKINDSTVGSICKNFGSVKAAACTWVCILRVIVCAVYSVRIFPTLHGGPETFLTFAVVTFALMGGRMEPVTEFIQYTGRIIGFVGTGVVWALFAIFVHSILAWLDEDKHVFERFRENESRC